VKRHEALTHMSMRELTCARLDLWRIRNHPSIPEHVKRATTALINFYGAEIDARMSQGQK
jgi:hypothetical protein